MSSFLMQLPVDANFALFGIPAIYTPPNPPGGSALPCLVIKDSEDRTIPFGDGRPFAEGNLIEIRASEVATPLKNGTIALQDGSGLSFTILADPQMLDPDRLIWVCRCQ
jgi:hypothetical protein